MFLNRFKLPIIALPRIVKRLVVMSVDALCCWLSVWLAFYLRLGEFVELEGNTLIPVVASIALALPIFIGSGLYRAIFRYSGWPALMTVTKATVIYAIFFASFFTAIGVRDVPRTIGLIQPILLLLFVGLSRAVARFWLGGLYQSQLKLAATPKVLIYGTGASGRQLAAAMANSHQMRVMGFLDDDVRLQGQLLNGKPVYDPNQLPILVSRLNISDVLLALSSATRNRRNEILEKIQHARVSVRTLPSVMELAQGKVSISDLHELDIDDLLGRQPVVPESSLLGQFITNKIILVTGAGGSIGSELCRQILTLEPQMILLIEQSEFALYAIHQELQEKSRNTSVNLVPLLASVRDEQRMREIMGTWKPDTVYHVAAYKHVPLVEHNPAEGIKNNVMGTLTTARVAAEQGVLSFVLISTDKAVRPTNIMGATKRLAEMVLQALAAKSSGTIFSMVRFGNVLGSSGSVVPKFRQQIHDGGPITLTHAEITRYFMTIPEAAQLVIQAGAMARGGDVFVLDMGEPVKIMDLAVRMIELSGLTVRDSSNPNGDIEIDITGLRPGEKLYEELLIGDNPSPTDHPRIMKAHEGFLTWEELADGLDDLNEALNLNDLATVRLMLKKMVSGYEPSSNIVDWVTLEQAAVAGIL